MRFLLKYKMILIILLPVILLLVAQIHHYYTMKEEKNILIEEMILLHITALKESADIQFLTTERAHLVDEVILYAKAGEREAMNHEIEELEEITTQRNVKLQELSGIVEEYDSEEGKEAFAAIQESIKNLDARNQEIITTLAASENIQKTAEEIMHTDFNELTALEDSVIEEVLTFNTHVFEEIDYTTVVVNKLEHDHTKYLINTGVIGVAIVTIALLLLYFQIIVPLNELTSIINEISAGNFKIKVKNKKRLDEIGMLAQAIENLLKYLQALVQINLTTQLQRRKK